MSSTEHACRRFERDTPLFAFDGVGVELGGRQILHDVDLVIADSGATAIIGPSGSGKSTLLRLCNRLVAATAGVVRFRGVDVLDHDPRVLRRRVGMVLQRPSPFSGSVAENLRVAAPESTDERLVDLLARVGLSPAFLDRTAGALSVGEAQRMCLARSLAVDPDVLLLDEPTSSLDEDATLRVEQLALALGTRMPTLWVSHDLAQARRVADAFVVMRQGRIVASGRMDHVTDGELRKELFGP